MAKLEYFLVAEDVSIDRTTNQVSAFNILEEVKTAGFPTLIPKAVALTLWCKEGDEADRDLQTVLRIISPDGTENTVATNFRMTAPRHRITQRIQGIPILGPGVLTFEVLLNGVHAAYHRVDIGELPPSSTPPGEG